MHTPNPLKTLFQKQLPLLPTLALVACVPTLVAFAAKWHWFAELWTHFRVYYAVLLVPCAIALLAMRWRKTAVAVGVCGLFNVALIAPLYFPPKLNSGVNTPGPALDEAGSKANDLEHETKPTLLTGMLINVHTSNQSHQKVIDIVQQVQPDFLLLMEINAAWAKALKEPMQEFTHKIVRPREDNFGIAFYSKLPVESLEFAAFGNADLPSVVAVLRLGERLLTVIGTHPLPPIGAWNAASRDGQLKEIAAKAKQTAGAVIVCGDLNATSWSPAFQTLLQRSGLRDSRLGFGVQPSWFAAGSLVRIPIDHVLVSDSVAIKNRYIGADVGSDHRPVIFTFSLGEE